MDKSINPLYTHIFIHISTLPTTTDQPKASTLGGMIPLHAKITVIPTNLNIVKNRGGLVLKSRPTLTRTKTS